MGLAESRYGASRRLGKFLQYLCLDLPCYAGKGGLGTLRFSLRVPSFLRVTALSGFRHPRPASKVGQNAS